MIKIKDIVNPFKKDKCPGYSLLIVQDGKTILEKTVGYSSLEQENLISRGSNFRLASVTKQFIAAAILVLLDKRKLSTEDTLLKFFPDFPDYGKDINIHHLLTHSSGIFDYEKLMSSDKDNQIHDEDILVLLKKQKDTMFPVGTKYSYSNGGYCLLRLIIEKVSGQTIDIFLKENLFSTLGMDSTIINYEGYTNIPNRTYGYSYKDSKWLKTDQNKTSTTIGDGGIYSSIKDMQKWSQIFYTDKVLSKEMRDLMLKRHILTDEGKDIYYGYGLCLKDCNNKKVAYHGGSSIGFQIGTYYIIEEESSIIFLSNRSGENGSNIVKDIANLTINKE